MNSRLTLVALPLVAVAAFAGASACAPNAAVEVQAICYPTDDCTFGSTCDKVLIGDPATSTGTVTLFVQVGNQLANNANANTMRVNTNDAHVDEIQIESPTGAITKIGTNQLVPAKGSTIVGVTLTGMSTTGLSVSTVIMRGFFDDGTRFETGDFPIAVVGCTSCIPTCSTGVACPPGATGQAPAVCTP